MGRVAICILFLFTQLAETEAAKIKKDLLYHSYTPNDSYPYGKGEREFQWAKISAKLDELDSFEHRYLRFGILQNYKNRNGIAPLVKNSTIDEYHAVEDMYGIQRSQSAPFYHAGDLSAPERYGRDGSLVAILRDSADYMKITPASFGEIWMVPAKYVKPLSATDFQKIIFVDRTNQNIATLEYADSVWLVRSMNPISTGVHKPPYKRATPPGVFVLQGKVKEMLFMKDGTHEEGGFSPWASRFSGGAYLHGVPVNYPDSTVTEYSNSLGTTPRSHMCVRNATSHAKFIYDWAPVGKTLVVVFD